MVWMGEERKKSLSQERLVCTSVCVVYVYVYVWEGGEVKGLDLHFI